eukprot:scaffold209169_cov37-Cyclotella_meneghiniana.AAC.1
MPYPSMSDPDNNNASAQILFWSQAHKLSCINHASFHSSVQTTYHDAMVSSSVSKDNVEGDVISIDRVREIMEAKCAMLGADGSISNYSKDDTTTFTTAMPIDKSPILNDCQLKTLAILSAAHLSTNNNINRQLTKKQSAGEPQNNNNNNTTSWMEYMTSPLRKVSNGLSHAIDSVLGDPYAHALNTSVEGGSELDDEVMTTLSNTVLKEIDKYDDDATSKLEGVMANHQPLLSNSDALFSLEAIATSCRGILTYVTKKCLDVEQDFFVLRNNDGAVDRILLVRNGRGKGSFTSLCHESGKYYSNNKSSENVEMLLCDDASHILSSIVSNEQEVNLILETLVASNHAIVDDDDTIILFPNRIIDQNSYTKNKSDHALFQIHTTRISIQHRMIRLEQDAKAARQNAVSAKRNDMTKLALMHMKRRKVALEELERCASLISNLDASELRLQRAKDDAQLVQTFASLKTALHDIRTSSGMDETNVDDLMSDIQEEMETMNLSSLHDGAIGPDIDEDELNEEFRLLEVECANETYLVDAISNTSLENTGGQERDELECSTTSNQPSTAADIETNKANVHDAKSRIEVTTGKVAEKRSVPLPA